METEDEFKTAVAILKELEKQQEALSDEAIEKAQLEATNCIETQFERIFLALAARKQQLLSQVDAATLEQKKQKETHENQLVAAIGGCKKILEASTALYSQHRAAAITIMKGASELKHESIIVSSIAVNFDAEVIHKIETYGSVYIPEQNTAVPIVATQSTPVQEVNKERVVTLAGSASMSPGLENGIGSNAKLSGPRGMCYEPIEKCFFVCDGYNNVVRKVTLRGEVSLFAAQKGDAQLCNPHGIAMHNKEGCLFVTSMLHHTIKKITLRSVISTVTGTGKPGYKDGSLAAASFHCPAGIAIDQNTGSIYVCDQNNHSIRKVSQGTVTTLAGSGQAGFKDGNGSTLFNFPTGIVFIEKMQCLVVCDTANNRLRRITLNGTVSTLCQVAEPTDITIAKNGKLYVTTYSNAIITIAQNENGAWTKEGDSITSNFDGPHGIVVLDEYPTPPSTSSSSPSPSVAAPSTSSLFCYVADCDNNRICKVAL